MLEYGLMLSKTLADDVTLGNSIIDKYVTKIFPSKTIAVHWHSLPAPILTCNQEVALLKYVDRDELKDSSIATIRVARQTEALPQPRTCIPVASPALGMFQLEPASLGPKLRYFISHQESSTLERTTYFWSPPPTCSNNHAVNRRIC